jgi:hypothetical protein
MLANLLGPITIIIGRLELRIIFVKEIWDIVAPLGFVAPHILFVTIKETMDITSQTLTNKEVGESSVTTTTIVPTTTTNMMTIDHDDL